MSAETNHRPGAARDRWRWHLYADASSLARQAVAWIHDQARSAVAARDAFRIVLAGGTTPRAIYAELAHQPAAWERWEIWFGDERCLPPGHPERNDTMAREALLGEVPIRADRIHRIPAELGPEAGATAYAEALDGTGDFDLVLLGLGEDGHTASLFPGHQHARTAAAIPVREAPKAPAERVSLTLPRLRATGALFLLVTGAAKQDALAGVASGDPALPATGLGDGEGPPIDVLADANAAGRAAPLIAGG